MYPEPGHRDTFVEAARPQKSQKPNGDAKSMYDHMRYNMHEDFRASIPSQRKWQASESIGLAMNEGHGMEPSYGRIMGLAQRLDKSVRQKMRVSDVVKQQEDAMKELQKANVRSPL